MCRITPSSTVSNRSSSSTRSSNYNKLFISHLIQGPTRITFCDIVQRWLDNKLPATFATASSSIIEHVLSPKHLLVQLRWRLNSLVTGPWVSVEHCLICLIVSYTIYTWEHPEAPVLTRLFQSSPVSMNSSFITTQTHKSTWDPWVSHHTKTVPEYWQASFWLFLIMTPVPCSCHMLVHMCPTQNESKSVHQLRSTWINNKIFC